MRNIILISLILVGLVSCNDDNTINNLGYSITDSEVEAPAEGGNFTVGYTIDNAIAGVSALAVCDADWLYNIDSSTYGQINFCVDANIGSEPREATIELRYPSLEATPTIVVRQSGFTTELISISLDKVDYSVCSITLTTQDNAMPYIVMMAEKDYIVSKGITDEVSLIDADIQHFKTIAGNEQTLEELFDRANIALRGEQKRSWSDLSPAKEYIIYAYGVDINGDEYHRTTPVYYKHIAERLPQREQMQFEATIVAEGPEVTFDVHPVDWQGYYMVQLVADNEAGYIEPGMPFTIDAERAVAEAFFYISDHLYYFEELSPEEIMSQLGHRGDAHYTQTLNAGHNYMALIYAIDAVDGNIPMVVSSPVVEYFSTGTVERSDMTFEVEFSNILPRSVDVTITPSTNETYTALIMYASNLPEGSNEEQLDFIARNYAPFEISGVYREHIDQLPPSTEFILAIYGFYAGSPTTELFTFRFQTAADGVGNNAIVDVKAAAYDLNEVAALEPYYASLIGYADYLMSVEIITTEQAQALHFDILPLRLIDEYGLEQIREMLLENSYTSSPDWTLCNYGNEYVVCGLAEDINGYIGDMYVSEPISFSRNETSDAAEFVELYRDYVPASATSKLLVTRE